MFIGSEPEMMVEEIKSYLWPHWLIRLVWREEKSLSEYNWNFAWRR